MDFIKRNGKRILFDGVGYLLIAVSPLVGLIPGPGGIAVALAGLGLLSVHNPWAQSLKERTLKNGGKVLHYIFPKNSKVEWTYDLLAASLLAAASYLVWQRAAVWQISLGVSAFFLSVFLASMNRDRLGIQHRRHLKDLQSRLSRHPKP